MKVIDLTNQTFGRLKVIERAPRPKFNACHDAFWLCRCKCGTETVVRGSSLRNKLTRSCGCLRVETSKRVARELHTKKKTGGS